MPRRIRGQRVRGLFEVVCGREFEGGSGDGVAGAVRREADAPLGAEEVEGAAGM